ncbi:MAG: hypothetical protein GY834_17150 [Bacteroidetes bacterium]|nr:hypothetical protein [Bacteroidota bacterium]
MDKNKVIKKLYVRSRFINIGLAILFGITIYTYWSYFSDPTSREAYNLAVVNYPVGIAAILTIASKTLFMTYFTTPGRAYFLNLWEYKKHFVLRQQLKILGTLFILFSLIYIVFIHSSHYRLDLKLLCSVVPAVVSVSYYYISIKRDMKDICSIPCERISKKILDKHKNKFVENETVVAVNTLYVKQEKTAELVIAILKKYGFKLHDRCTKIQLQHKGKSKAVYQLELEYSMQFSIESALQMSLLCEEISYVSYIYYDGWRVK